MRLPLFPVICAFISLVADPLPAAETPEPDPTEILRKMEELMRGNSSYSEYRMTIVDPDWERSLSFEAWEQRRGKKTFIQINSPPKEKGIVTLKIDAEMWNYLPRVERVVKVPPSMMLQPWMGSDFSNDDLVKASSKLVDYTHTLLSEETYGGYNAYLLELLPRPDAPIVWGKVLAWVRADDSMPLRQEFYSESGKLIRTLEYENIRVVRGRELPTRWIMTPKNKQGRYTVMELIDLEVDGDMDESMFSLRSLKRSR